MIKKAAALLLTFLLLFSMTACQLWDRNARSSSNGFPFDSNNNLRSVKMPSASMEPVIPAGATVYYEEVDPAELAVGDIIVFYVGDEQTVVHRITEISYHPDESGTLRFFTKGDANSMPDAVSVKPYNILGRVVRWEKDKSFK